MQTSLNRHSQADFPAMRNLWDETARRIANHEPQSEMPFTPNQQ
jgi:hypothetical protein